MKSFINIGLDNTGATPVVLTSYPPDATVPLAVMDSSSKVVLPDGSAILASGGNRSGGAKAFRRDGSH